tara:strand:- start:268 stop:462 length:195 start_codon:yes stop_codon:yes gene_type:complete
MLKYFGGYLNTPHSLIMIIKVFCDEEPTPPKIFNMRFLFGLSLLGEFCTLVGGRGEVQRSTENW